MATYRDTGTGALLGPWAWYVHISHERRRACITPLTESIGQWMLDSHSLAHLSWRWASKVGSPCAPQTRFTLSPGFPGWAPGRGFAAVGTSSGL